LAGLWPICLACLQLWGFLYVLFLAWMLHRLIYQDASRVFTAVFIVPAHFVFSFIVLTTAGDSGLYWDRGLVCRLAIAVLLLMAPLIVALVARRFMPKGQEGANQQSEGL